jgi:hypothetical protein
MLKQCVIARIKKFFESHTHQPPQNHIRLLGELSIIHSMHWRGAQGLMWGTRGPILPGVAMVVAVVMPVVCCYSVARAQTTLVQWNPGILIITGKL